MPSIAQRSGRGRRTINEINMVPFIDVMLVLLIIFMVTAPLISPSVINIPSVGTAAIAPSQVITIEISKDNQIQIQRRLGKDAKGSDQKKSADLDTVAPITLQLQGEDANSPVIISADKTIAYENVVKVMDKLQRAGVQRIGLSVQVSND